MCGIVVFDVFILKKFCDQLTKKMGLTRNDYGRTLLDGGGGTNTRRSYWKTNAFGMG